MPGIDTLESLPIFYARWLAALLPGPLPIEVEATCSDCAMLRQPEERDTSGRIFFDKESKCCTYCPTLSNFMVGAILNDKSPAMEVGRVSILQRLSKEPGTSPLGLLPSPTYSLLYSNSPNAFGQNRTLLCPHFIEGSKSCSIWAFREPTCVSWFCKHLRGKTGQNFWRRLHTFLLTLTRELSLWCVLQLDLDSEGLTALELQRKRGGSCEDLQPNELDGQRNKVAEGKIWGLWLGREKEFYTECYKLVSNLSYQEIEEICGPEVQLSARLLQDAYAKLKLFVAPAHLQVGRFTVESVTPKVIQIWSYSRLDPLAIPVQLFKALPCFDGRPTADVLSFLEAESGIHLDSQLLRTLIDFGILEESEPPKPR